MSHPKAFFYDTLHKVGEPIISAGVEKKLKRRMPVRSLEGGREGVSHLEAVSRLLVGLAPALELNLDAAEDLRFVAWIGAAQQILDSISDPESPDYLNFAQGTQPLVDSAFLAQALMRAPKALWRPLPRTVQQNLIAALRSTRAIKPHFNNWLLFSAIIEAFFCSIGEEWDRMRVDYALRQHEQWYVGDGTYSDGPEFHWDYYNSFVIHPMLLDITRATEGKLDQPLRRARRLAVVLERLIGPQGSFALLGRSLAYRCGSFHLLAQLAYLEQLPAELAVSQVRGALHAVIESTLGSPANYDEDGWLHIGVNAHQPKVGERYISTGSLYLCSAAFLPLGLPRSNSFWTEPDRPWTQRAAFWLSSDIPADKAL